MLDKPAIPDETLKSCLLENYGIPVKTLEFLPLGLDTQAGVYRVTGETGEFFLKLKKGELYEPSAHIPRFLADRGIEGVVAPLPNLKNELWCGVEGWTGLLYPFIKGTSSWEPGLSDEEWRSLGQSVRQIHDTPLPPEFLAQIRREKFSPEEYSEWMLAFENNPANFPGTTPSERLLAECWTANREAIHQLLVLMERLAARLREESAPLVICHADLHPGNTIRTPDHHVFLIDWDDVMLALKERDFLFVGMDYAAESQTGTPFCQGYGDSTINWTALTYYLCERVITDLLVCARDTFFSPNLSDQAREESSRLFCAVLGKNGEVQQVYAAARHLTQDLL